MAVKCFLWIICFSAIFKGWFWTKEQNQTSPPDAPEGDLDLGNVIFQLYTRENEFLEGDRLFIGNEASLKESSFNPNRPTIIMTHGFLSGLYTSTVQMPKDVFLQEEDCNFIGIDWSTCAKNLWYPTVVRCSRDLGYYVSQLLLFLEKQTGMKIEEAHLIGHSLGAHAMGIASRYLPRNKIGRITALDPASPLTKSTELDLRVDSSDALVVDAIHTAVKGLGIKYAVGTLDFYPNGGYSQPGCRGLGDCNHSRSTEYFVDTISKRNREKYKGRRCYNYKDAMKRNCTGEIGIMGYDAPKSDPGIYYVPVEDPSLFEII